jgi:hypothetical protein
VDGLIFFRSWLGGDEKDFDLHPCCHFFRLDIAKIGEEAWAFLEVNQCN